jgi:multiple sugar transport system permease protein
MKKKVKETSEADAIVTLNKRPLSVSIRPWLILMPTILITIGIFYPFFSAIYYSLTDFSFRSRDVNFIGFENWVNMFKSSEFWHSLWVTIKFAAAATCVEMVLGLLIALTLNADKLYIRILKVVLIFPLMVAPVIAVMLWQLMTNTSVGVIEKFLNLFGVYGFPWAASSKTALFTVVLVDVWVNTPFVMLLALAGLQSMPKSPFEAAQIDGGSKWFTFKTLTFPMLKPVLLIALIFRLMASLQEFSIIYSMTKGGPGDTLMNLSVWAYNSVFSHMKLGESLPYILMLWIVINLISQRLVKYWLKTKNAAN